MPIPARHVVLSCLIHLSPFFSSFFICCYGLPDKQAALEDALDSTTLGDLWFERGELDEARYEHLRALRIRMSKLRQGHPDIAESLESLGNVAIREVGVSLRVCVYVCVFIKLHITTQSGPVILVILCHSH